MDNNDLTISPSGQLVNLIAGIPAALVPASIKALDRLIGSAVDIPIAWLVQQRAKIDAQTSAFTLVEASIARAVADKVPGEREVTDRAMASLVRTSYRKQVNREAVATVMIDELSRRSDPEPAAEAPQPEQDLSDDWLNAFEKFAEDASSERLQKLWGRVLAGEVSRPGRFSVKTLRILAEIDSDAARDFQELSKRALFGIYLYQDPHLKWSEGPLFSKISRLSEVGLVRDGPDEVTHTVKFESNGRFVMWGNSWGAAGYNPNGTADLFIKIIRLTAAGCELLSLIDGVDEKAALTRVVEAEVVPVVSGAGGFAYVGPISVTGKTRTIVDEHYAFGSRQDMLAAIARLKASDDTNN